MYLELGGGKKFAARCFRLHSVRTGVGNWVPSELELNWGPTHCGRWVRTAATTSYNATVVGNREGTPLFCHSAVRKGASPSLSKSSSLPVKSHWSVVYGSKCSFGPCNDRLVHCRSGNKPREWIQQQKQTCPSFVMLCVTWNHLPSSCAQKGQRCAGGRPAAADELCFSQEVAPQWHGWENSLPHAPHLSTFRCCFWKVWRNTVTAWPN